ncbi:hypothetical protein ACROYT_G034719 [Oculina patagonica]
MEGYKQFGKDLEVDDEDNFKVDTEEWALQTEGEPGNPDKNPDEDPDEPQDNMYMDLLNPLLQWYFFLSGQWFAPVSDFIEAKNLPRKACRIAYAVWQGLVVAIMWSFFAYSMGFFSSLRTLQEVDWLCPLTDIKNMAYGLSWIVNQHTGLVFFLMGNLENLLKQLSITKEDVSRRASSTSLFFAGSIIFLFILPIGMHVSQMLIPDFMPVPSYRNGTIIKGRNGETFPPVQIVIDAVFYTLSRAFALPVFYVFLNMLLFLSCEVEKFEGELKNGQYPREDQARKQAIKIKNVIKDTEKAFRFFLALYIALLLLASALEIFSIVEKIETVITTNHTMYIMPASATAAATTDFQTLALTQESIKAFPHRLAGKHSIPYILVVIPPGNISSAGTGSNGIPHGIPHAKVVIDQYKLKTQEIVVTAVLDITQNVVLYLFPLYKMSRLKSCLKSVVETVENSDYGEQKTNTKIFETRQDKKDFKNYFRDTCTSGIRVLGREVSFLWTLVLTFFGPFAIVVVNLMFKHIHVETPWH